jgi:hypothetical protein
MVMSLCTRSTLIWIFMVLTHRYHNTSSVTYMLQTLTWPTLQQRRLKTKLIMFYKIVHHIVAVLTTILIPTDPRIRQFHPFTYRHLHAFKYPYKYSFFPNTIIHWNLLPQTHEGVKSKTGWFGIGIMCASGANWLPAGCCFFFLFFLFSVYSYPSTGWSLAVAHAWE